MYSSSNDAIDIVEVGIRVLEEEGGIEVMGMILILLLLDDDDGVIITDVS